MLTHFLRSVPGRVLRVILGVLIYRYSAYIGSALVFVPLVIGTTMAITAIAGTSPEAATLDWCSRHLSRSPGPRERHA